MKVFSRSWAGRYRKLYLNEVEKFHTERDSAPDEDEAELCISDTISDGICQMEETLCVLHKLVELAPYKRQVLNCVECKNARLPVQCCDSGMGVLDASLLGEVVCACGQDTARDTPCNKVARHKCRALKDGVEGGNS